MSQPIRDERSPFGDLAAEYDAWFEGDGKLTFAIEVKAFEDVLPTLPQPWLEMGVGSGRFAQALGIEVGIDPCAELLALAGARGITTYQVRGELKFFNPAAFGTVFLIVTLCFVDSAQAALKEAHRILKPDGRLVLGLVLWESPWGEFYQKKKREGHRFYEYATLYSYQEMKELLAGGGFVIAKTISTLFQRPGEVKEMEMSREGYYPDAGFTMVVARKQG